MKQTTHNGLTLSFYEKEHKYVDDKNNEYTSVTTFLKRFYKEFDTEEISKKVSLKKGIPQDILIKKWEKEAKDASDFGTKTHLFAECLLLGQKPPEALTAKEKCYFEVIRNYIEGGFKKNFEFVGSEVMVFNPEELIAGTIDLIAIDRKTKNLCILDWKTNKKIEKENKWQNLLPPFNDLPDASFYKYSLQLSKYKDIMKKTGIGKDLDISGIDLKIMWVHSFGIDMIDAIDYSEKLSKLSV